MGLMLWSAKFHPIPSRCSAGMCPASLRCCTLQMFYGATCTITAGCVNQISVYIMLKMCLNMTSNFFTCQILNYYYFNFDCDLEICHNHEMGFHCLGCFESSILYNWIKKNLRSLSNELLCGLIFFFTLYCQVDSVVIN